MPGLSDFGKSSFFGKSRRSDSKLLPGQTKKMDLKDLYGGLPRTREEGAPQDERGADLSETIFRRTQALPYDFIRLSERRLRQDPVAEAESAEGRLRTTLSEESLRGYDDPDAEGSFGAGVSKRGGLLDDVGSKTISGGAAGEVPGVLHGSRPGMAPRQGSSELIRAGKIIGGFGRALGHPGSAGHDAAELAAAPGAEATAEMTPDEQAWWDAQVAEFEGEGISPGGDTAGGGLIDVPDSDLMGGLDNDLSGMFGIPSTSGQMYTMSADGNVIPTTDPSLAIPELSRQMAPPGMFDGSTLMGGDLTQTITPVPGQAAAQGIAQDLFEGTGVMSPGFRPEQQIPYLAPGDFGVAGSPGQESNMGIYGGDALGGGIEPETAVPLQGINWAGVGGVGANALINYLAGQYIDDPRLAKLVGATGSVGVGAAQGALQGGLAGAGAGALSAGAGAIPALLGQYLQEQTGDESYGALGKIGGVAAGAGAAAALAPAAPAAAAGAGVVGGTTIAGSGAGATAVASGVAAPAAAAAGMAGPIAGAIIVAGAILASKLGEGTKKKYERRLDRAMQSQGSMRELLQQLTESSSMEDFLGRPFSLGYTEGERTPLTEATPEALESAGYRYGPLNSEDSRSMWQSRDPENAATWNPIYGDLPTLQNVTNRTTPVGNVLANMSGSLGEDESFLPYLQGLGYDPAVPTGANRYEKGNVNSLEEMMSYSGGNDQWTELLNYLSQLRGPGA